MTYWQMDDRFLGHHKTVRALRAGAEALQMWIALRSYCANNETDGFVPDEDIDDLPGAPREPRRWLKVLTDCGKPLGAGKRGAGLVDPAPEGWALHDYADHALLRAEIEAKREATRQRVARWRSKRRDVPVTLPVTPLLTLPHPIPSHPIEEREDQTRARGISPPEAGPPIGGTPAPHVAHPNTGQRCADALTRPVPALRPDVLRVHEAWKRAFQRPGAKFVSPFDEDAITIAKTIDVYGEKTCFLALKYAPEDDKVTGRTDEKGEKHQSIRYIFGNNDAFTRILALANRRESALTQAPIDLIARLKQASA